MPLSAYRAEERLKAMDIDGIDAQVLYANVSGTSAETFVGREPAFEEACVRAYNDYLAEEWLAVNPQRLLPLALMPYAEIESSVSEVRRAIGKGLKGIVTLSVPDQRGLPHFNNSYWEPLWSTIEELDVPLHFHGYGGASKMFLDVADGTGPRRKRAFTGSVAFNLQAQFYANMIMSGLLDRHPTIAFVCAESGLGWVPYVIEMLDYEWNKCQLWKHGMPRQPSQIFRGQCYVDFWYERAGLAYRDTIGINRIMWETDFPHPTSIFPDSQKWLDWSLEGVPEDQQRLIRSDNAVRLYKLGDSGRPT